MTRVTLTGQVLAGDVIRVPIFDGDFTTGFRLKRLEIAPENVLNAEECTVRLLTQELDHVTTWNWGRNDEVGWAIWNAYNTAAVSSFSLVDEEVIIVEDLWIDCSADSGEEVNYLLEMEKISFSDWKGALAMVQNRSQDV